MGEYVEQRRDYFLMFLSGALAYITGVTKQAMAAPPSPNVIDWLISSLARRMYGAVDLGLIKCLSAPPDAFARWAADHFADPLRCLASVIRLAASELATPPPAEVLEGVATWADVFGTAFVRLGGFRSLPADAARDAATEVSRSWGELRDCVEELGSRLGRRPTFLDTITPEREREYRAMLTRLPADVEAARRELRS